MDVFKRFPILGLTLANAVVFAVLAFTPPVAMANPIDDCQEEEELGCGCLPASVWYPAGCYGHAGVVFDCEDGEDCG